MFEIIDKLWIGSYLDSLNDSFLEERKITHLLSCLELPLRANLLYSKEYTCAVIPGTGDAISALNTWINDGHNILVYCGSDMQQSICVLIEFLMKYKKWSYELAYNHLKLRTNLPLPY
jgi:hypothetical protein